MQLPEGLTITDTIVIESADHLSDVLGEASDRGTAVLPVGGGTCLTTGYATDNEFTAIDLSRLNGIDNYVPTDMTASFQAGTPLSDIRAALAANGQELPLDLSPNDAGTIGGLVATGFSGPRRLGQGTLKDVIIGCEYVRGDGLLAKAGGMTVKNVSGFEIGRLLHGSWGSLAVLTRINLKLLPTPRVDRTYLWNDVELKSALDRQMRLHTAFAGCLALQTTTGEDGCATSIRFVGREPAIEDYLQQLAVAEGEPDQIFDDRSVWVPALASTTSPQLVAGNSVEGTRSLALKLGSIPGVGEQVISLPTGTVRASLQPDAVEADGLTAIATGMWMVEGGDSIWKQNAPVWGPSRPDQAVAKSIKDQFDPAGILNRGRLFV